jgi:hypothetical protein
MLVERGSPFFIQLLLKLAIVFASLITAHGQVDPFSVFDSVDPGYVGRIHKSNCCRLGTTPETDWDPYYRAPSS